MATENTPPSDEAAPTFSGTQLALADAVREIEQHVSAGGWDGPVRLFALIETAVALEADPSLAQRLPAEVVEAARVDPHHLTSIEQDGVGEADDLEGLLARVAWPPTVAGAALVVERIVLPPEAEQDVPEDPEAALAYLRDHPAREDVRIGAGALRDGSTWCALRSRANDDDAQVSFGPTLVPGLVEALASTLEN
ncbi:hypothetical protein SAMN04489860_2307 [Paraoerskovia marina]|uniref:Uncharacterized protein n=1 Tax=Paraoerskovia marina TaxID=545619 RepID=A0A1H1UVT2_9CELL|nr:PPA1309 family protein [Paraoerskovia marina]SDS76381.1 hypothetical protein SAMN04489860_2307 [Paraoerskovia marina]